MKLFLSTTLRAYIQDYDPAKGLDIEVPQGATIADLCSENNIPINEIKIIMVDGRRQEPDYVLTGAERVYLFPPVGGG